MPADLAKFYDDMGPSPSGEPPSSSGAESRAAAAAPADRRAKLYDDMGPSSKPDQGKAAEVEAARSSRLARFYDDAPSDTGAEKAAPAKQATAAKQGPAGADAKGATPAALAMEAPEGFDPASPGWQEFTKAAAELKLDDAGAKKLLALHQAEQARARDVSMDAWEAATRADREIGGDRFDGAIADAQRALKTHGTQALNDLLEESGLGSHPEVLRFLVRVARTGSRTR